MDISQKLTDWLTSEKSEVEPSLLAYVLLCKNYCTFCKGHANKLIFMIDSTKNMTGLVDILRCLASFWEEGDAACRTKCNYMKIKK